MAHVQKYTQHNSDSIISIRKCFELLVTEKLKLKLSDAISTNKYETHFLLREWQI